TAPGRPQAAEVAAVGGNQGNGCGNQDPAPGAAEVRAFHEVSGGTFRCQSFFRRPTGGEKALTPEVHAAAGFGRSAPRTLREVTFACENPLISPTSAVECNMATHIQCPVCGKVSQVAEPSGGKGGRCNACGASFPALERPVAAQPPPEPAVADSPQPAVPSPEPAGTAAAPGNPDQLKATQKPSDPPT